MFKSRIFTIKFEKGVIDRLRDVALKESIANNEKVRPSDIIIRALKKIYPELFTS